MNTLRRTLGWIGGVIMATIYVIMILTIWPFVRRTELELKDDLENEN